MSEEARKFAEQYGGLWSGHAIYELEQWQHEVSENNTRQSYWDWVMARVQEDGEAA